MQTIVTVEACYRRTETKDQKAQRPKDLYSGAATAYVRYGMLALHVQRDAQACLAGCHIDGGHEELGNQAPGD